MPERAHCTAHQRYIRDDGTCIDCDKITKALEEIETLVRELHAHELESLRVDRILYLCNEARSIRVRY